MVDKVGLDAWCEQNQDVIAALGPIKNDSLREAAKVFADVARPQDGPLGGLRNHLADEADNRFLTDLIWRRMGLPPQSAPTVDIQETEEFFFPSGTQTQKPATGIALTVSWSLDPEMAAIAHAYFETLPRAQIYNFLLQDGEENGKKVVSFKITAPDMDRLIEYYNDGINAMRRDALPSLPRDKIILDPEAYKAGRKPGN